MVVIPSFISMHTENCVDLFCHTKGLGYRNYSTEDNSTNIWWLGYFGFGQGWHNNHHYAQNAACYSKKWWELDLTRPMIFIIKAR
jgi:stearoyl-CoA desaturase (delta-9 desaturase)